MTVTDPSSIRAIVVATANPGKFREIVAVLSGGESGRPPVRWLSLGELDRAIPEPVEDGATFAENAALKARYYSRSSGFWALADDSGLEVDALGGEPGVRSARFAGAPTEWGRDRVDQANNEKLMALLVKIPPAERTARFRCAIALADGDRILATSEGKIEGRIIDRPRGTGGFGYDPYFLVPSLDTTTAELPADEKNRISHRGQALRRFCENLRMFPPESGLE